MNIDSSYIIYSFSTFDDYCSFIEFFSKNGFKASNFAKSILLYEYKNSYYLVLKNINLYYPNIKKLLSSITEFATFVSNSNVFASKLLENGILIMKNNAILLSLKHFIR